MNDNRRYRWSYRVASIALLSVVANGASRLDGNEAPDTLRPAIDSAIAAVRPALVRIRVVSTDYYEGREVKTQAVGSGAIITEDGVLITNHHVAGHGKRMFCTLWNREEMEAELVGTDPLTDISILKLKPGRPYEFIPARFGDSTAMRVGDPVLAMGSPMALSQSVTFGIISNTEMIMPRFFGPLARFELDGEDVGSLVRWLGHDAPIYGGNSGGPLVNLDGEIIGINEISLGLGGAIPGNLAKAVADQIVRHGKVRRSWLGIDVQPLFKHGTEQHGILISGILEDSPAAAAGLKAGDVLLQLNGKPIEVRYDEQLPEFMRLVTGLPIGKEVEVVVQRNGADLTLHLDTVERGELYPKERELKQWGLTARDLSFLLAREMKRDSLDGVVVTSVRPGGPAGEAKPAIGMQDVIVEVGGKPVQSVQDLIARTRTLTSGATQPVPVLVTFERKAARYLAVVKVGIEELKDPGLEVTKAWLPIETHSVSRDIAKQLGRPNLKGFYITRVYPDMTAETAGLQAGDFIVAVDGEKLIASGPEHDEELSALIRQYDIGQVVELTVRRGDAELQVPVELMRSPRLKREMKQYRDDEFEFTGRDLSFYDIAEQQWSRDQRGVWVEAVKSGGWAELGSLYVGDLIVEVNGEPVDDVGMLRQQMRQISSKQQPVVVMKVMRGIHTAFLELEPDWKL